MICQTCAFYADLTEPLLASEFTREPHCRKCLQEIAVYSTDPTDPSYMTAVRHWAPKVEGEERVGCPGSSQWTIVLGHSNCPGCDCQHHPRGTRQVRE